MGLNDIVSAERIHIGFFGLRNAGKSSLVNAVAGQEVALVSEIKGTTTDPVKKSMELLPLGPVVLIDTPGMDDEGTLGGLRVKKARQTLNYVDIAILTVDAGKGLQDADHELITRFENKRIPYLIAYNKADLLPGFPDGLQETACTGEANDYSGSGNNRRNGQAATGNIRANTLYVSAAANYHIHELKEMLAHLIKNSENHKRIVADLLVPNDTVVLVVPIDSAAPKGRLILPQQQTIRDILEAGAIAVVSRNTELPQTLASLNGKPKLVITDSQAFGQVSRDTPEDILLTSFSILFARYKGSLTAAVEGAAKLKCLQDGDTVLVSEGCTHHRQCGDIGTVKLPAWIKDYTNKNIRFAFTSGMEFPEDLREYALVVHCGGCMLNEREMQYRLRHAADCGIPMTNYGIAIAQMHGILKRSLEPFPDILEILP